MDSYKEYKEKLILLEWEEPKNLGSSSGSGSWQGGFGLGSGSLFTFKVWVRFGSSSSKSRVRVRFFKNRFGFFPISSYDVFPLTHYVQPEQNASIS